MKRHLPGLLVFAFIVGISAGAFSLIRSLSRSLDTQLVPPVTEAEPLPNIDPVGTTGIAYEVQFVQYKHEKRRLTARLEIDRSSIGRRSSVAVAISIYSSENTAFRSARLTAIGRILPGQSEKAIILVEAGVPANTTLRRDENYYAAFSFASHGGSVESLTSKDFGKDGPIVFVHPRSTTIRRTKNKGPIILQ